MITRWIGLQFSFSNPDVIPTGLRSLEPENWEMRNGRKSYESGEMVVEPINNCLLSSFPGDLELANFEVVAALYQERIDAKGRTGTYNMVRFAFVPARFAQPTESFSRVRSAVRAGLQKMCDDAMWRVRIHRNPFFVNGEDIGQTALSINLEARRPLFYPDGKSVTVWQKDEWGDRVGEAPMPLQPDFYLRLLDGKIRFETEDE